MSVDTYLKGKDTSAYTRLRHEDLEVLVAPAMVRWSQRISMDRRSGLLRRGLDVALEHEHGPT